MKNSILVNHFGTDVKNAECVHAASMCPEYEQTRKYTRANLELVKNNTLKQTRFV